MRIMKLKSQTSAQSPDNGVVDKNFLTTPEGRVSYLRYRIDVESRLGDGARKIMIAKPDRKASLTVRSVCLCVSHTMNCSSHRLKRVCVCLSKSCVY